MDWFTRLVLRKVRYEPGVLREARRRRRLCSFGFLSKINDVLERTIRKGDEALLSYLREFHKVTGKPLTIEPWEIDEAKRRLSNKDKTTIEEAYNIISEAMNNITLEIAREKTRITNSSTLLMKPIKSLGLYAPGGTQGYPSTLLMTGLAAKAIGVPRIILSTPPQDPKGRIPPSTLYAAELIGIKEILRLGGAYAAIAMALGTQSIRGVDKLSGPGGPWYTCAKLLLHLYGIVGIDLPAGPTELFIIADSTLPAEYIALDMLAQAEHSPLSQVILASTSRSYMELVEEQIQELIEKLAGDSRSSPEAMTALESLSRNGLMILVSSLSEAVEAAREYAPEHLYLAVGDKEIPGLEDIPAGAIGVGPWSPPALGDYTGGVNHVLPTGGSARWRGGLTPLDYVRTPYLYFLSSREEYSRRASIAARLARLEGFVFHALSLEARLGSSPGPSLFFLEEVDR